MLVFVSALFFVALPKNVLCVEPVTSKDAVSSSNIRQRLAPVNKIIILRKISKGNLGKPEDPGKRYARTIFGKGATETPPEMQQDSNHLSSFSRLLKSLLRSLEATTLKYSNNGNTSNIDATVRIVKANAEVVKNFLQLKKDLYAKYNNLTAENESGTESQNQYSSNKGLQKVAKLFSDGIFINYPENFYELFLKATRIFQKSDFATSPDNIFELALNFMIFFIGKLYSNQPNEEEPTEAFFGENFLRNFRPRDDENTTTVEEIASKLFTIFLVLFNIVTRLSMLLFVG